MVEISTSTDDLDWRSSQSSTALVLYTGPNAAATATGSSVGGNTDGDGLQVTSSSHFVGLCNQGATCYMNSLLQTLFMTPEFRSALYQWEYRPEHDAPRNECIALQLQRLFGLLQLSKQTSVSTVALTRSFGWEGSEVFQQQDVQELCRVLFDALEDAFKDSVVDNCIDELYAGEMIDYIKCVDVDYESERKDKFLDFSLAIKPFGSDVAMHSLHECIEHYLEPEVLDGDNKYYVESMNQRVDAIKGLRFSRLPQVMSVQLKRFVYDFTGDDLVHKKINEEVRFPFVIDMNKYVSGGFDEFLSERIERLKKSRVDPSTCVGDNSGTNAELEVDYGANSSAKGILTDELVGDSFADMPDLVDCNGGRCAEQLRDLIDKKVNQMLLEDEEKDAISIPASRSQEEVLMDKCYDPEYSFAPEELDQLIATRGEWIYELFAVLIHSGAITGGHYYAYIKDFDSKSWFNFNDSSVTEIDTLRVKDAWGGSKTHRKYGLVNGSYRPIGEAFTGVSSSNAYMLMYRKVRRSDDPTAASIRFPISSEVPEYVTREMEELRLKEEQRRREEEESWNKITLRVFLNNGTIRSVLTDRRKSYKQFLEQLWTELFVYEDKAFSDMRSKPIGVDAPASLPIPNVPLDRIRLRLYHAELKLPQDVYDVDLVGNKTLFELGFTTYRLLYLQTKDQNEPWDEYIVNGVNISIISFDSRSRSFAAPKPLRIATGATGADLKKAVVSKWCPPFRPDSLRLLKIDAYGPNVTCSEIEDDGGLLDAQYRIFSGSKVYVDEGFEGPLSESPSVKVFEQAIHRIIINLCPIGGSSFNTHITIDKRLTIDDLRNVISKEINVPPYEFRLHRHMIGGMEIQNAGTDSLVLAGVYDNINIALSAGTPLKPGYFSVLVKIYDNQCEGGIFDISPLCYEDAITKYGSKPSPKMSTVAIDDSFVPELIEIPVEACVAANNNISDAAIDVVAVVAAPVPSGPVDGLIGKADVVTVAEAVNEGVGVLASVCREVSPSSQKELESTEPGGNREEQDSSEEEDEKAQREDLFGYKKVTSYTSETQFETLMRLEVTPTSPIAEMRRQVWQKLVDTGKIDALTTSPRLIRLRELWSNRASIVLRDGFTFREHNIQIMEGKQFAVQILQEESAFDCPDKVRSIIEDQLLFVRRWDRRNLTLGPCFEVYVPGDWRVDIIAACLGERVGITSSNGVSTPNLQALVIRRGHSLPVHTLRHARPPGTTGWVSITKDIVTLGEARWYLASGDMLLIQDASESLRPLTAREEASILKAQEEESASSSSAGFMDYSNYGTSYTGIDLLWPEDMPSKVSTKSTVGAARPVGIQIRKHKASSATISSSATASAQDDASGLPESTVSDSGMMATEDISGADMEVIDDDLEQTSLRSTAVKRKQDADIDLMFV